jgi:ribonuclease BN (tRNA processing enzyme)
MKIQVLGCSAVELPNARLSSFLIDGKLLLDAGTIGPALDEISQWKIKNVLLTHAHLDHIKDIPFFADNIYIHNRNHQVTIMSIPHVINALKNNLLNDIVWPDFTKLPTKNKPIIRLKTIKNEKPFMVNGYTVTAFPQNHTVPSVGYLIEKAKGKNLLYTGDTGPNGNLWERLQNKIIDTLIIEASFPNRYKSVAIRTGHLTPKLLEEELLKITHMPKNIFITHCKPTYKQSVIREIKKLKVKNIKMLQDGEIYKF